MNHVCLALFWVGNSLNGRASPPSIAIATPLYSGASMIMSNPPNPCLVHTIGLPSYFFSLPPSVITSTASASPSFNPCMALFSPVQLCLLLVIAPKPLIWPLCGFIFSCAIILAPHSYSKTPLLTSLHNYVVSSWHPSSTLFSPRDIPPLLCLLLVQLPLEPQLFPFWVSLLDSTHNLLRQLLSHYTSSVALLIFLPCLLMLLEGVSFLSPLMNANLFYHLFLPTILHFINKLCLYLDYAEVKVPFLS